MFCGIKTCFLDDQQLGKDSKRTVILKKLVKEHGGKVVRNKDADRDTYFISDDYSLVKAYGLNEDETVVLGPDWISDSIESKDLKPIFSYLKKPKHARQRIHPESNQKQVEEIDTDSESENVARTGTKQTASTKALCNFNYDAYECERETPLVSLHNQSLIDELSKIEHARYLEGEHRSELSYRRAIAALKSYPEPITSASEAANIRGVGSKISHFVGEWIETGKIREAEILSKDSRLKIIDDFCKIYGVGPSTAHRWYDQGMRNVEEIKEKLWSTLNHQQQIGMKYYDDFNHPMSQDQVKVIAEKIHQVAQHVLTTKATWNMTIVGGYARGKLKNNDVDMIICPDKNDCCVGQLVKLVSALRNQGLVKEVIAITEYNARQKSQDEHFDKCFCVFKLPTDELYRRVDIILCEPKIYPFVQLGWIGSGAFERSLRRYAETKRGIRLNSSEMREIRTGISIPAKNEREIFDYLGLAYIPPSQRNC